LAKITIPDPALIDHSDLAGLTVGDDHTQYQLRSEKSAANGYAPLDAGARVPTARLGSGTADATTFLRGDQTYAAPAGGGGVTLYAVEVRIFYAA